MIHLQDNEAMGLSTVKMNWRFVVKNLFYAYKVFYSMRGSLIAASSSFYFLLTIVPMAMLLIRIVGFFVGDIALTHDKLFLLTGQFLPSIAPGLILKLKAIIDGLLRGQSSFSAINFFVLLWSSLLFLNSIWHGFYQLTGDLAYRSLTRHFKGLVIIISTILLLNMALALPMLFTFVESVVRNNFITNFLFDHFPSLRPMAIQFLELSLFTKILIKSNLLHAIIVWLYFSFLYRWFWAEKISIKVAMIGAVVFVLSFFIGKFGFYFYVFYLRNNYIDNYGDYYTFLLALIWLFFVLSFFFYGACVCKVLHQYENVEGANSIKRKV